jgi:phospho-N-acetylmuramoyl-pentapeptide-transferase
LYFIIYLLLDFNTTINFLLFEIDLKFFYGLFILLAFSGFTNATNLTDGIDGLLGGVLSIILIGIFYINDIGLLREISAIMFSGLCAFLYYNLPKARVFMGNVGSLSLGGLFVSILIVSKQEIFLFIFGLIFIIEALSVVLQVSYFKATKGKRIFKMSPIHHHFEIVLNSEIKTLILFYLFTIITVVTGLFMFYLF